MRVQTQRHKRDSNSHDLARTSPVASLGGPVLDLVSAQSESMISLCCITSSQYNHSITSSSQIHPQQNANLHVSAYFASPI